MLWRRETSSKDTIITLIESLAILQVNPIALINIRTIGVVPGKINGGMAAISLKILPMSM